MAVRENSVLAFMLFESQAMEICSFCPVKDLAGIEAGAGEALNRFDDSTQPVAAVGRKVLGDAHLTEKSGVFFQNFIRPRTTVKIAEQAGDALDNGRV